MAAATCLFAAANDSTLKSSQISSTATSWRLLSVFEIAISLLQIPISYYNALQSTLLIMQNLMYEPQCKVVTCFHYKKTTPKIPIFN